MLVFGNGDLSRLLHSFLAVEDLVAVERTCRKQHAVSLGETALWTRLLSRFVTMGKVAPAEWMAARGSVVAAKVWLNEHGYGKCACCKDFRCTIPARQPSGSLTLPNHFTLRQYEERLKLPYDKRWWFRICVVCAGTTHRVVGIDAAAREFDPSLSKGQLRIVLQSAGDRIIEKCVVAHGPHHWLVKAEDARQALLGTRPEWSSVRIAWESEVEEERDASSASQS